MKLSFTVLFLFVYANSFSQNTETKTNDIWEKSIAFRGGIGVQKSLFTEIGISKFYFFDNGYFPITKAKYISVEFSPTLKPSKENTIYALKIGYEYTVLIVSLGIEAKYQTDFTANDFVITPKIGLGAFGVCTLYYGLNISANDKPFSRIGTHQLSIICNLSKKIKNKI